MVRIRWFGLLVGFAYAAIGPAEASRLTLSVILSLGLGFTLLDTWFNGRRRVFLGDSPMAVSSMEGLFIGLLCVVENSHGSPFRYYYLLSLLCCALRYSRQVTFATFLIHCVSYGVVFAFVPRPDGAVFEFAMTVVILGWATWASSALGRLLRRVGDRLASLNAELRENQSLLESRIEERTRELQETQAQVMHQDKMAGFGLLAAGVAHEVGNPLTAISTIVQVLERRGPDEYTREKLHLVGGQLARIQGILRDLTTFSRPASMNRGRFGAHEIVIEAMNIAKFSKGTKSRTIRSDVPAVLPVLYGLRDQLVQVVFNLVLNAIDATSNGGLVEVSARVDGAYVEIAVRDDGAGIAEANRDRVFRPYFTTKKMGTGLGLFVSQKIVGDHGGTIDFSSQPGEGTTFRVRLPVDPAQGHTIAESRQTQEPNDDGRPEEKRTAG